MPVIYKAYWLLHTLAVVIAIGITGSYFVVDYDPGKNYINHHPYLFPTHLIYPSLSLSPSVFYIRSRQEKHQRFSKHRDTVYILCATTHLQL
jgi:O-antigen/teichoic acid export membrane protein